MITKELLDALQSFIRSANSGAIDWIAKRHAAFNRVVIERCLREESERLDSAVSDLDPIAWSVAFKQWQADPKGLTDDDLATLTRFDPAQGRAALRERSQPPQPVSDANTLLSAAPASAALVIQLKKHFDESIATFRGTSVIRLRALAQRLTMLEQRLGGAGAADTSSTELAELRARVKALESRPTLQYRGVFEPGTTYGLGDFITHGGSMWSALRETATEPGTGSTTAPAWRLAVKRGRDGRDASGPRK